MPPLNLRGPHQFHDRRPDFRRQTVSVCYKPAKCHVLPAKFRRSARHIEELLPWNIELSHVFSTALNASPEVWQDD